jgi:hypothetical protein
MSFSSLEDCTGSSKGRLFVGIGALAGVEEGCILRAASLLVANSNGTVKFNGREASISSLLCVSSITGPIKETSLGKVAGKLSLTTLSTKVSTG